MGQGNLCVVADRIRRMLGSEDIKEIGSQLGIRLELLMGLEDTISRLTPKLLVAEKKNSIDDERVRDWLMRLEEAVYDADNLLEELSTEALRHGLMTNIGEKMTKQVCSFFTTSKYSLFYKLKLPKQIVEMTKILDGIEAEGSAFDLDQGLSDEGVQGMKLEEDKNAITFHLLMDYISKKESVKVHAIVGVDRIGITKLARDVFNDERVQSSFQVKIWVDLSHNFDPKQILTEIVEITTGKTILEDLSMERLESMLDDSLTLKRFLIVLDDVGNNEDPRKWKSLIDILEDDVGLYSSKIIVTTRSMEVASSLRCTMLSYPLQILDEEQSWVLFKNVVGVGSQEPKISNYQIQVGKEMVNKCMGLPIAITTIGRMLRFEGSDEEWRLFHENLDEKLMLTYNIYRKIILRTLKLSYDQLPPLLKPCFAYCSLFPVNYKIDVQTLIKLWMAQGFIESPLIPGDKSLEDTGYEYFLNLLERSYFQEAEKDVRGRVTKCRMHDLMHGLSIYVAGNQCSKLPSWSTARGGIGQTLHVSFDFDLFSVKEDIPTPFIHAEKIRSLLLPCQSQRKYRGIHDKTISGLIISRFRFLRALDMHALGIKIVPDSIGQLKLLKYLDLSENGNIKELPNSITNLLNLQTLRLSSCFRLKMLPRDLKHLINLRTLEIDGCYNLTGVLQRIRQLPKLQTLSQVVLSEKNSVRVGDQLNEVNAVIDKFHIKNLGHEKNDMAKYMKLTPQARSLSLDWETDHAPKPDEEKMAPLGSELFSAVEELSLYGFGGDTLFSEGFPSNLIKLSLWRCQNCEILPPLDQLSNLKVLVLNEIPKLEYISEMNASSSTATVFPSLRELWLTELPKLRGWWKSGDNNKDCHESFHCLSKLVIEDCPELASMPLFPTLEEELVLETTCLKAFQLTMSMKLQDEASSSTSLSFSPLSKLKRLCIGGIDDLKADDINWYNLKSLRYLRFDCLPKLVTLPWMFQFHVTSLQELHVWRCGIKNIPKGIVGLRNLEKLVICLCPSLTSLPKEISRLQLLRTLIIADCPTLLRRCEKDIGEDWYKIAHIEQKHLGRSSGR